MLKSHTTSWIVIHSVRVERECLVRGINSNGNRTVLSNGDLQSIYVTWSNIDESRDLSSQCYIIYMTESILKRIIFTIFSVLYVQIIIR